MSQIGAVKVSEKTRAVMMIGARVLAAGVLAGLLEAAAVVPAPSPLSTANIHTSGVFPSIVGTAESAPKRSECGVGAMMAWNDVLYYITYLSGELSRVLVGRRTSSLRLSCSHPWKF